MASLSDYLEDALRDHVLRGTPYTAPVTVYLALYVFATTDTGLGSEVSGGGYARQPVTFSAGAPGVAVSDTDITFTAMPAATVTHAAICDALTGGNVLLHGPLSNAKTVTVGASLTFPAGDVGASFA